MKQPHKTIIDPQALEQWIKENDLVDKLRQQALEKEANATVTSFLDVFQEKHPPKAGE